jgi:hypothetical protein
MGEKALDRSDQLPFLYPPTTTAALTETSKRTGINACDLFLNACVKINVTKYRSQRRKDQLNAVARLLLAAALLFTNHADDTLQRWNVFLLPAFLVVVWDFPTAYPRTPMQRAPPR